jgi:hypothetical protein
MFHGLQQFRLRLDLCTGNLCQAANQLLLPLAQSRHRLTQHRDLLGQRLGGASCLARRL